MNGEALKISVDKDIYIAGYGEKYVSDITFSLVDKKYLLRMMKIQKLVVKFS